MSNVSDESQEKTLVEENAQESKLLYTKEERALGLDKVPVENEKEHAIRKSLNKVVRSLKDEMLIEKAKRIHLEEQLTKLQQAKPLESKMTELNTENVTPKLESEIPPAPAAKIEAPTPKVEAVPPKVEAPMPTDLTGIQKQLAELEARLIATQEEAKRKIEETQEMAVKLVKKTKGEAFLTTELAKSGLTPTFAGLVTGDSIEEIQTSLAKAKALQESAENDLAEKLREKLAASVPKTGINGQSVPPVSAAMTNLFSRGVGSQREFFQLAQEAGIEVNS